jgi:hypothetical protein
MNRIWRRLDEDPNNPVYYPPSVVLNALNVAHRLWCYLTLVIEKTVTFNILANTAFYKLSDQIGDMIVPLRVTYTNSGSMTRLRPTTLHQLNMFGPWSRTPVDLNTPTPKRYSYSGSDLIAVYPQVNSSDSINITYASFPSLIVGPGDTFGIPDEDVNLLPDAAVYILRIPEGGVELNLSEPGFNRFLSAAQKTASYMRERMKAQRYDMIPPDVDYKDRSWMVGAALTPSSGPLGQQGQPGGGGGGR